MLITDEHCLEIAEANMKGYFSTKAVLKFMFDFEDFVSRGLDPAAGIVCSNNCGTVVKFTKDQKDSNLSWTMVYLIRVGCPVCPRCYSQLMIRGGKFRRDQRESKG